MKLVKERSRHLFIILSLLACEKRAAAGRNPEADAKRTVAGSPATPLSISPLGIGSLRIGMTVAEAGASVAGFSPPSHAQSCDYASAASLPAGLLIMVENDRIVRVDVDTNTIPTIEGARVGDTIPRIFTLYKQRVSTTPNFYSREPDLRIRSANPSDTIHEIIFETVRGRVTHYRAGQRPQVRYIEGCA